MILRAHTPYHLLHPVLVLRDGRCVQPAARLLLRRLLPPRPRVPRPTSPHPPARLLSLWTPCAARPPAALAGGGRRSNGSGRGDAVPLTRVAAARRAAAGLLALAKPRLTVLVVLTAVAPYGLYPAPEFLSAVPAPGGGAVTSALTLACLGVGTGLCAAAANALNMAYEPATDAQMARTRGRPLVRGLVSRRAAVAFAAVVGAAGTGALLVGVNSTVACLGAANIALYAGVYTPLKAVTAANTWVGAVVGAVPPLMGWTAAAGEAATGEGRWAELLWAADGGSRGGWLLAAVLFAWQFPHFMALSWTLRHDYRAAGLRMLSWTNPARNTRVALRYSLALVPLCVALCAVGVTDWSFAATSLPVNAWVALRAVQFWRYHGRAGSARRLFWASVWHLPAIMVLALLQKKGMWQRVWRSLGAPEYDDDDDDDDEADDQNEVRPSGTKALRA